MDALAVGLFYLIMPVFVGVGFVYLIDRLKEYILPAFGFILRGLMRL